VIPVAKSSMILAHFVDLSDPIFSIYSLQYHHCILILLYPIIISYLLIALFFQLTPFIALNVLIFALLNILFVLDVSSLISIVSIGQVYKFSFCYP